MAGGSRSFPQHIFDSAPDPAGAVRGNAQGDADPVRGFEADTFQIVTEPVRILADNIRGLVPVEFADLDRQRGRNSVGLQEYHGAARGLMFLEAFGDHGAAFFSDSGNLRQPLRMLRQDGQCVFPEMTDNQDGSGRTDTADQPAPQVPLDSQQGCRNPDFT